VTDDVVTIEVDLTKLEQFFQLGSRIETVLMNRVLGRLGIVAEGDVKTAISQVGARRLGGGIESVEHIIRGKTVYVGPTATSDGFPYMDAVQTGSGIYGPSGQVIRPKEPGGVLAWEGKSGEMHFARFVRGMKPRDFINPAFSKFKGHAQRHAEDECVKFLRELGVAA